MSSSEKNKKIANFFYELGSLRRIPRAHRQSLMINENADNIASHSHRVACIAWFLAKMEKADPYKAVTMALFHDVPEIRSGDHNWIHKRYVKIFEEEIIKEQLDPFKEEGLYDLVSEYNKRESKESLIAKDADLLDQVLLLKEYEWEGNKEATVWLYGNNTEGDHNQQLKNLKTDSAMKIGLEILQANPSDWWKNLWTNKNR